VRRELSNTPLQSLTLWNDAAFYEAARHLARRIVSEAPQGETAEDTLTNRLDYAFHVCLGRMPEDFERQATADLYRTQLALCRQDGQAAAAIVGKTPPAPGITKDEQAAWVIVGRTLMNLDEFITRE
jgi:hypothetical protein